MAHAIFGAAALFELAMVMHAEQLARRGVLSKALTLDQLGETRSKLDWQHDGARTVSLTECADGGRAQGAYQSDPRRPLPTLRTKSLRGQAAARSCVPLGLLSACVG